MLVESNQENVIFGQKNKQNVTLVPGVNYVKTDLWNSVRENFKRYIKAKAVEELNCKITEEVLTPAEVNEDGELLVDEVLKEVVVDSKPLKDIKGLDDIISRTNCLKTLKYFKDNISTESIRMDVINRIEEVNSHGK